MSNFSRFLKTDSFLNEIYIFYFINIIVFSFIVIFYNVHK